VSGPAHSRTHRVRVRLVGELARSAESDQQHTRRRHAGQRSQQHGRSALSSDIAALDGGTHCALGCRIDTARRGGQFTVCIDAHRDTIRLDRVGVADLRDKVHRVSYRHSLLDCAAESKLQLAYRQRNIPCERSRNEAAQYSGGFLAVARSVTKALPSR
jgi:hypothetical protein